MKTIFLECRAFVGYSSKSNSIQVYYPSENDFIRFSSILLGEKYDLTSQMLQNDFFWNDLLFALDSDDTVLNKLSCNILQYLINEVEKLKNATKNKADLNTIQMFLKNFIELYQTLDCFAVHLVKAIFKSFSNIVSFSSIAFSQYYELLPFLKVFNANQFCRILMEKSIKHDNVAVRKFCIKHFLLLPVSFEIIDTSFIYEKLIPILNNSVFFKDVGYEEDSKFYLVIKEFFKNIFGKLSEEERKRQMNLYCEAIANHATLCHALIALTQVNLN